MLTQWATRTLPSEQVERPLPEYLIGPRFLGSLDKLEGIKKEKVADVVFEIVTGLAPQIPSREVHHLRTGTGGDNPIRKRDDGAVAWRASLQVKTPSARRIHLGPSERTDRARSRRYARRLRLTPLHHFARWLLPATTIRSVKPQVTTSTVPVQPPRAEPVCRREHDHRQVHIP